MSRPIAVLPERSRSILRSTTILTSLPQVVFELVQNSLDAGALHIEVGVDIEQWHFWVRDDGHGMDNEDMRLLAKGGEAGRYGTSKAYDASSLASVSTFGFRGEALASAADISCLEISSKTSNSPETWSVILKGGQKLYYGAALRWKREKPGTTVCIRDAFYNLPIRRRSHPSAGRTLELIRRDLECLFLIFHNVSFSLQNISQANGSGKGRILGTPKLNNPLAAFRHLFGRALCEHVEEIDVVEGEMKLKGFISLKGTPSKSNQYFYVNQRPLQASDFHRVIDSRFVASSFGRDAVDKMEDSKTPQPSTRRSPRKNERRPVYVLNILLPSQSIDNCLEPAKAMMHFKDKECVCSFLATVVDSFLVKHGFLAPSQQNVPKNANASSSPSPLKKMKVTHAPISTRSSISDRGEGTSTKVADPNITVDPSASNCTEINWIDTRTGRRYIVNSRTGITIDTPDEDSIVCPSKNRTKSGKMVDRSRLRSRSVTPLSKDEFPDWMQETLQDWQNPIFGREEPSIPSLSSLSSFSRKACRSQNQDTCAHHQSAVYFDAQLTADKRHNANDSLVALKTESLKQGKVVAQVDNKYIACLIPKLEKDDDETLILVDQHAADERIRVERFLAELCKGFLEDNVEVVELKPAVPVLLTRREAYTLNQSEKYQRSFARWGFKLINLPNDNWIEETQREYVQVFFQSVPEVISDKVLQGDELCELVKGHLARLEEHSDMAFNLPIIATEWTAALRHCPRELLDLVNSKACRGAIMFNDSLNGEQCQRLISQLSGTVWPFMCAHGRPSLVPLTDIHNGWNRRVTQQPIEWKRLVPSMESS